LKSVDKEPELRREKETHDSTNIEHFRRNTRSPARIFNGGLEQSGKVIAVLVEIAAGSIAPVGFGFDSVIEVSSGLVLLTPPRRSGA
jgi:hypothetical protein